MELARRLNSAGKYAHGYYIIGFPSETPESIREDLGTLSGMGLDVTQTRSSRRTRALNSGMNGHPVRNLRERFIENDTKHLVWSHPNCSRESWSRYSRRFPTMLRKIAGRTAKIPQEQTAGSTT